MLAAGAPLSYAAEALGSAATDAMTPAHLPLALRLFAGTEPAEQPAEQPAQEPGQEDEDDEDEDERANLRYCLAEFLRTLDDPAARAAAARYDAEEEEREYRAVLDRLGADPAPAGRAELVRLLIDRVAENPYQGDLIKALGKYGDASALPVLTATLGHEHGAMQAYADRAIERIGGPAARREAVLAVLRDPAAAHRRAAYAAGRLGLTEAVPGLIGVLRDGSGEGRAAAVAALARLRAVEAVPDIAALPWTTGQRIRSRYDARLLALRQLGPGPDPARVEDLALDMVRWSVLDVRGSGGTFLRDLAVDVLALCDSPRATELVAQTLLHGTVRAALVRPLAERGDPALVEVMIHVIRTATDPRIRRLATEGIRRAAHHPDADPERLGEQLRWLRDDTTAAWLEPRVPERPGRMERLRRIAAAEEPRARAQAVKSLALLGTPEALELVAGLRADPSRHVRACVEGVLRGVPIADR
ncbi:HEAT repeat domain-containing protein [Kitasatospora saccharophila]|uniref:HEAT repeat domain-containing protein n=1 Tax=Kitasatospora saccharophila TaxID=407973 RepID=UPI003633DCC4